MNQAETLSEDPRRGLELKTIASRDADGGVALEGGGRARLALVGYSPEPGDRVLVGVAEGDRYVVGVVSALRALPDTVSAEDGVSAGLERDDDDREVLRVRDAEGRLLLEHRPHDGKMVISAAGDLVIDAAGDLELGAGGDVRVRARGALAIEGASDVAMRATDLDGAIRSSVTLREGRAQVVAERLGAKIERADVAVEELNLVARTVRTVAQRVKTKAETVEVDAARVVERAKESWRETEGLAQTTAGRLRLFAKGALTAVGESALLRGKGEVKIKGDKIYLA